MSHPQVIMIVFESVLVLLIFYLIFIFYQSLDRRIAALEVKPPEEPPKKKAWTLHVKTNTGTTKVNGTTIRYPTNGQLHILHDDAITAIFAPGHWRSITVGELEKTDGDHKSQAR